MTHDLPPDLLAGAAQVEITPAAGTHLSGRGDGAHRPAEVVLDPLYARAAVFCLGQRQVCFLALEVTIVTQEGETGSLFGALEYDPGYGHK